MTTKKSNIVSLQSRLSKKSVRIKVTFQREGLDALITVDPPSFMETTEGRELLADYCTSLVDQIFQEDDRVRQLFLAGREDVE